MCVKIYVYVYFIGNSSVVVKFRLQRTDISYFQSRKEFCGPSADKSVKNSVQR